MKQPVPCGNIPTAPIPGLPWERRSGRRTGGFSAGCNVENASYGLTLCAEQCAIFAAVKEGVREFAALCVTADTPGRCPLRGLRR